MREVLVNTGGIAIESNTKEVMIKGTNPCKLDTLTWSRTQPRVMV